MSTTLEDEHGESGTICGTPNYMPPEVISKMPHGLASDCKRIRCMYVCMHACIFASKEYGVFVIRTYGCVCLYVVCTNTNSPAYTAFVCVKACSICVCVYIYT